MRLPSISVRERAELQRSMPAVWRRLIEIATGSQSTDADAIKAASILLDRTYGRVMQAVQIEDKGGSVGASIAALLDGRRPPETVEMGRSDQAGQIKHDEVPCGPEDA